MLKKRWSDIKKLLIAMQIAIRSYLHRKQRMFREIITDNFLY